MSKLKNIDSKESGNIYNHLDVEKKWKETWEREKTFSVDLDNAKNPYYNLMMFPYPSAEGLHVGNFYAFTGSDVYGRYMKMKGYDVFQPMGWDAFGIHSENFAKKIGSHPITETPKNVKNFKRQFSELGALVDWDNEINTTSPEYYKWNQWLFLKLFENGLAYKKKSLVNWCPECQTVISNEQVIDGKCERHGDTDVEKKEMEQWFLKITEFAEELYSGLDNVNWSDKTKITQKNWIGEKEGFSLKFQIDGSDKIIETFTTNIDTIYGVSFLVVSCDSNILDNYLTDEQKEKLSIMRKRKVFSRKVEKEGLLLDIKVVHPLTKELLPVYITDYVDGASGTGAIMGVPGIDNKDKEFADKYDLEVKEIYKNSGNGLELINSGEFTGMSKYIAIKKIAEYLESINVGEVKKVFKLRDWCISRQRYWGTPIPIIDCKSCGLVPEKEEKLPIKLPIIDDYKLSNNGKSPLSLIDDFVETSCPCCNGPAKRETDVMDNFFDSSWYFFRYLSANNNEAAFDLKRAEKWLPVDTYIGGNEHAVLHLMYTRFITKFLNKIGIISFNEPFKKFFAHGLIIKDGKKMSKSKGNIINPDDYIEKYGADALRLYLMFLGPLEKGGNFTDSGIISTKKFIGKVYNFVNSKTLFESEDLPLEKKLKINELISKFNHSMDEFKYNVAISQIMIYFKFLQSESKIFKKEVEVLLKTISIFCPYFTEELWNNRLANGGSIHLSGEISKYENIEGELKTNKLAIQVGGKFRALLEHDGDIEEDEAVKMAKNNEKILKQLDGKTVEKIIYIKGKVLNFIIK